MKTDRLIEMLARGAGPAPRAVAARRLVPVAGAGLLVSATLALALLGPIPQAMLATPAPWIKLAYATALAVSAGWLTSRLAQPVARLALPARWVIGVLTLMVAFGALSWLRVPETERTATLMGHSWRSCPWSVLVLSLPALAGALWAVRGLAPTRLRSAGFAAGLMAGAVGALGYSLACPETSAAFVAVWYTLGILSSAALGALLGPVMLRW